MTGCVCEMCLSMGGFNESLSDEHSPPAASQTGSSMPNIRRVLATHTFFFAIKYNGTLHSLVRVYRTVWPMRIVFNQVPSFFAGCHQGNLGMGVLHQ